MDHLEFKANQTAAGYVTNGLDDSSQEAFEVHMMSCAECVEDVEIWRSIKLDMPKSHSRAGIGTRPQKVGTFGNWRMAASLVGATLLGAGGGWLGKGTTAPDLDLTRTVVFNLPTVSRGADECTTVRLTPDTRLAVIRVPAISRDLRVVALDAEKRSLPVGQYGSRVQPDGSQLLRIQAGMLVGRSVSLEARGALEGPSPLGCITGAIQE